ncbi:MAG: N-acetyl-gamma-glutamyl-phosphate reductase [Christensenellaceae bacterium]|jgi:N-acetyl-gamma-glutamyl-phosphate reductase|nr:N-acetyl-gamma-glutamyl-phosphate reductase [Christensenellaceae bacterium]
MVKVFIDGNQGTTGLRIHERLAAHPAVELLTIEEAYRKDDDARASLLKRADIAFLCLPDAAAKEAVALAAGSHVRLLDTSTAHRVAAGWSYGFPELSAAHRAAIQSGGRTAVPGCHASGFLALTYPLVACGILPKDALLCATSVTGYTGGGKKMIAEYEAINRAAEYAAPRQYALGQAHKHLPEMQALSGLSNPPAFLPMVGSFPCGMAVTIPLHAAQLKKRFTPKELQTAYAAHYAGSPVIQALPMGAEQSEDGFIAANALSGKDSLQILVTGNQERMLVHARFDNLGKGASGAAIQCMNIMLGLNETTGLTL